MLVPQLGRDLGRVGDHELDVDAVELAARPGQVDRARLDVHGGDRGALLGEGDARAARPAADLEGPCSEERTRGVESGHELAAVALEPAMPVVIEVPAPLLALEVEIDPGVVEFDPDAAHYVPLEEVCEENRELWLELIQDGVHAGADRIAGLAELLDVDSRERSVGAGPEL